MKKVVVAIILMLMFNASMASAYYEKNPKFKDGVWGETKTSKEYRGPWYKLWAGRYKDIQRVSSEPRYIHVTLKETNSRMLHTKGVSAQTLTVTASKEVTKGIEETVETSVGSSIAEGGVEVAANLNYSVTKTFSVTKGEAASYTWNVEKEDPTGFYVVEKQIWIKYGEFETQAWNYDKQKWEIYKKGNNYIYDGQPYLSLGIYSTPKK